jgi:AcrR family transcriptional regulator
MAASLSSGGCQAADNFYTQSSNRPMSTHNAKGARVIPSESTAGRPRLSSRQTIQDAAAELFLENGYAKTAIDHITQRAGVSRATFFNYFAAKSDLLWVPVDEALDALERTCGTGTGVRDAILAAAGEADGSGIPLVVTQEALVGSAEDVAQSGLLRVARLASIVAHSTPATDDPLGDRARAYALAGSVAAAWLTWARVGTGRGALADYVSRALDVVA